jgi:probable phosphoglycerate mutase
MELTEEGLRQAEELAARLAREFSPRFVYSSAFRRARQTAEIVGRVMGVEAVVLPDIHERNFGCLRGQPYTRMGELMLADARYNPDEDWLWSPEGGESHEEVRVRVIAALRSLMDRHPDDEVAVVCHGAVIQSVCAHVAGDWRASSVPPNCGVVVIEHSQLG